MKKINFLAVIFPFLVKRRIILMRLRLFYLEKEMNEILTQDSWLEALVKFFQVANRFNEKKWLAKTIAWLSKVPAKNNQNLIFQITALERLSSDLRLIGPPGSKTLIVPSDKISKNNLLIGGYGFDLQPVSYWLAGKDKFEKEPVVSDRFLNTVVEGNPITIWELINDHIAGDLVRDRINDILYRIALLKKFGGEIE